MHCWTSWALTINLRPLLRASLPLLLPLPLLLLHQLLTVSIFTVLSDM